MLGSLLKRFWAIVLILSILGCIYMVALLWNNFISKPTRVYSESNQASTNTIPFPAVTICNTNTISKVKVQEFVDQLHLYGENKTAVAKAFEALLAFRFRLQVDYDKQDLEILQKMLEKNRYSVPEVMKSIGRTCDEVLVRCSWLGKVVKCGRIFQESLSATGFCCSFNYNNMLFTSAPRNSSYNEYTLYPGYTMGLSALLDSHEEKDKISYRITNGMEVAIHQNGDFPGARTYRKSLSTGLHTFLQISGSRLRCSEEVAMLHSDKRGCVLDSERYLRFFKKYSQNNCYLECEALFILTKCGCLPYFYDFKVGPTCSPSNIPCLFSIRHRNYSRIECNCPSKCDTVNYNIVTTGTTLRNTETSTWSFMTDVNVTADSVLLSVFFVSQSQEIYRRDVVSSGIYLLASFGGIFGLFLGWSFITGTEIVYYFIVRIILERNVINIAKKRHNKKKKKRPPSCIYQPRTYLP